MDFEEKIDSIVTMMAGEETDEKELKWKICDRLNVSARTAYELMKIAIARSKRLDKHGAG